MGGRIENLKQCNPGKGGNPGGRPKGRLIDEALQELLQQRFGTRSGNCQEVIGTSQDGEVKAIQLVAERVEGKPKRHLELSGPGGGPLYIHRMTDEELNQRIAWLTES